MVKQQSMNHWILCMSMQAATFALLSFRDLICWHWRWYCILSKKNADGLTLDSLLMRIQCSKLTVEIIVKNSCNLRACTMRASYVGA
jgi:hypothetical protein